MNVRSIHVRLTFWYTAVVLAVSLVFGAFAYYSLKDYMYKQVHLVLSFRIDHIRDDLLAKSPMIDPDALGRQIRQIYSPEETGRFIRISKAGGDMVYVSGKPRNYDFEPDKIPPTELASQDCVEKSRGKLMIRSCPATLFGTDYIIDMGTPLNEFMGILHKLIFTLLFGLPIAAAIAIVGGSYLVRKSLQPVEVMRATAEQISFGNVNQRLPVSPTGDAIGLLSKTLNQMLERLDLAYQHASRFSADASHELRTPLAIVRSELEAILHARDLPAAMRERIGSILEETERLSGIVEGLFSLARLDAGEAKIGNDTFNLSDMVRSTLDQMQLLADEKKLSVTVDAPQPVYVKGDAARLKQVIVNLLDNAIKYTMTGGSVALSVRDKAGKAVISIKDNGIGIPANDLPHIFDRFYRADKVRTKSQQGAGLGLSIVRSICQAHGGNVEVRSEEGVGTVLTVELPLNAHNH